MKSILRSTFCFTIAAISADIPTSGKVVYNSRPDAPPRMRNKREKAAIMLHTRTRIHQIIFIMPVFLLLVAQGACQSDSSTPANIESRVESILSRMTVQEKIDLLGG